MTELPRPWSRRTARVRAATAAAIGDGASRRRLAELALVETAAMLLREADELTASLSDDDRDVVRWRADHARWRQDLKELFHV